MQKIIVRSIAVACLALPLAAAATGHRKPGLWDVTVQMQLGGTAMPTQQPQIPPETLAKMQQMGIQMPQMTPGGGFSMPPTKVCVTPEEAARDDNPSTGNDQQCHMTNSSYSGNSFSADMVCDSPQMKGSGTVKATFDGDQSYTGVVHFSGTMQHGAHTGTVDTNMNISAKWLGADCGSVKPHTPPAPK